MSGRRTWEHVAFALALALPSLGTVEKYANTAVAVAYLVVLLVAVPVAAPFVVPAFLRLFGERTARVLAWVTFAALVVAFVVVHPIADSHDPGTGSDRDDAANLATGKLLDGEYPYDELTYLGNPVSQMPGALLLGAPFVALGDSAYQNLFWLPLFFVALARRLASVPLALLGSWTLLGLSPEVLRELVTGGDLLANTIYVALPMLVVLGASGTRLGLAAALFLGVAYSSRANFLFTVPLLAVAVAQVHGARVAAARLGAAAAAFAAVTLPFYLYDPDGFTPKVTSGKLTQFNDLVPNLHVVILGAVAALTLGLALLSRFDREGFALMASSGAVQIVFLLTVVVLDSVDSGAVDFSFLVPGFGLIALAFAALGSWAPWSGYRRAAAASS